MRYVLVLLIVLSPELALAYQPRDDSEKVLRVLLQNVTTRIPTSHVTCGDNAPETTVGEVLIHALADTEDAKDSTRIGTGCSPGDEKGKDVCYLSYSVGNIGTGNETTTVVLRIDRNHHTGAFDTKTFQLICVP
jgi:hypothetical protein